jgi:signal peptidase I
MIESAKPSLRARSTIARIGICLLNLAQPGFGLIRLGFYRVGFAMIFVSLTVILAILADFSFSAQMTYDNYIFLIGLAFTIIAIMYLSSIFLSWRNSAELYPRDGRLWRWYSLIGLWILLSIVSYDFPNIIRRNYRTFNIPSYSMAPTLDKGDMFVANMRDGEPISRGEVVIVRRAKVDYVKRVAAVPGDTIAMRDGVVMLNGISVSLRQAGEVSRNEGDGPQVAKRFVEKFPGEAHEHDIFEFGQAPQDNVPEVKLGPDQYFLLGDNRDNSLDSRFDKSVGGLGVVSRTDIIGQVLFRFWRSGSGLGEGRV